MKRTLHNRPNRRSRVQLLGLALAVVMVASSCGSEDPVAAAAAAVDPIETNDGGLLVKPPDVLEGDPVETDPLDPPANPAADLPPLVEGAPLTPVVDFEYFDGTASSTVLGQQLRSLHRRDA